jgi:hypothetical protein
MLVGNGLGRFDKDLLGVFWYLNFEEMCLLFLLKDQYSIFYIGKFVNSWFLIETLLLPNFPF